MPVPDLERWLWPGRSRTSAHRFEVRPRLQTGRHTETIPSAEAVSSLSLPFVISAHLGGSGGPPWPRQLSPSVAAGTAIRPWGTLVFTRRRFVVVHVGREIWQTVTT